MANVHVSMLTERICPILKISHRPFRISGGNGEESLLAENSDKIQTMTDKIITDKDVLAVLDNLSKRIYNDLTIVCGNGDRVTVELDISDMGGSDKADILQYLIEEGWELDDLTPGTAKMTGSTGDIPKFQ